MAKRNASRGEEGKTAQDGCDGVEHANADNRGGHANSKRAKQEEKPKPQVSAFRARVFELVRRVPEGKVTTYGRLARALDCGSAQAIGQAMRHNPFAMLNYTAPPYPPEMVPCHRVIASSRALGGFSGQTDPKSKQLCNKVSLLKKEGVTFEKKRGKTLVKEECIVDPPKDKPKGKP
ncbi:methylated-DNA/protein-cysteinemethyltransferase [Salpingoeca rosetta]|uniref:Methylated-DNA--protein-cysteine methyltransferase n=1 Tax=Salpingoeca rosetta (strain ATCC 50818 / BSB-021) TaxID=946362 RepID=F2U9H7_SALR5|nr:methylated-DNA/protein-cysteinemethyltransferase [Salpingoeca rosetta]EGD73004.1 methylated-DNA/protein-cysteinemethyltransferase [Salpingoeca rosetta]|eukprot:XP_004994035.1 methylated-DNA/protein-cysteinemethyltransferase [Salpingoeca rosetta]